MSDHNAANTGTLLLVGRTAAATGWAAAKSMGSIEWWCMAGGAEPLALFGKPTTLQMKGDSVLGVGAGDGFGVCKMICRHYRRVAVAIGRVEMGTAFCRL